MATIEEILKAPNMQRTIEEVKSGVPNPFDPALFTTTSPVDGDYAEYRKVDGSRELAQRVAYGGPSKNVTHRDISEVPVKLIHTFENIRHKPAVMNNLLSDNNQRQLLGEQEIGRQTQEFKARYMNLRISAVASGLALGAIYFNEDGQLLSSSSGAKVTIDYGIPAGNKDQLDWDGNGDIIDGDWDTAATTIVQQMKTLKSAAVKLSGFPIETAYYGANILGYLLANTEVLNFAARVPTMAASLQTGIIPDGFLGIPKWRAACDHVWVDDDGSTLTTVWDDDGITFVPPVDRSWWDMFEGSIPVPNNLGAITDDGLAALANVSTARGMFNYAHVTSDPVGIKHLAGDTFLPIVKATKAIWIAIVSGF